jgi:hypothetical protein
MLIPYMEKAPAAGVGGFAAEDYRVRIPRIGGAFSFPESPGFILPVDSYVGMPFAVSESGLFLHYPRSFELPFNGSPITKLAVESRKAGEDRKADSLFRLAFARGERAPETVDAIDIMTSRILASGFNVFLDEIIEGHREYERSALGDVASIKTFLQGHLNSTITLMDVIDVMQIFSPLFPLEGISITYDGRDGRGPTEFTVDGIYEDVEDEELIFRVVFDTEEGARLVFSSIDVGPFVRMGFGTRSLLSRATFLRRHGASGWNDVLAHDGITAWPRMGAMVDGESIQVAAATLEELSYIGAAKGFENIDDGMGIEKFSKIKLGASDVLDGHALMEWFTDFADIPTEIARRLRAPYEVGLMALESVCVCAYFDVEGILDYVIRDYLPERISKLRGRGISDDRDAIGFLADIGLFWAYQRARDEIAIIDFAERATSDASMIATPERNSFGGLVRHDDWLLNANGARIQVFEPRIVMPDVGVPDEIMLYGSVGMQDAMSQAALGTALGVGSTLLIR